MADIDVKPKSKTPWWLWLILLLVALALLFFFLRGCDSTSGKQSGVADTTTTTTTDSSSTTAVATTTTWDNVDFDSPKASYDEITDTTISVRGSDKYTIYSLGENLLFATDKAELQGSAGKQLQQIVSSLQKRFKGATIGVYGRADAKGDKQENKELGAQRAEAVRNWLVSKGKIDESKVSVHSYGETQPLASNATAQGRQQNRSVEIVAMPDSAASQQ
jgi:outer membrane protein OmpA-like peptidoglycan-associated protein